MLWNHRQSSLLLPNTSWNSAWCRWLPMLWAKDCRFLQLLQKPLALESGLFLEMNKKNQKCCCWLSTPVPRWHPLQLFCTQRQSKIPDSQSGQLKAAIHVPSPALCLRLPGLCCSWKERLQGQQALPTGHTAFKVDMHPSSHPSPSDLQPADTTTGDKGGQSWNRTVLALQSPMLCRKHEAQQNCSTSALSPHFAISLMRKKYFFFSPGIFSKRISLYCSEALCQYKTQIMWVFFCLF